MDISEMINLIKDSFESWYNKAKDSQASIVISYNDVQASHIKAIHTVNIELAAVGINQGTSFIHPLLKLQENYNHGVTSEEDAKKCMIKKLLTKLYSYK